MYHSICAFGNDFDELGGGYIIVGVDSNDKIGMAIRPVEVVSMGKIDSILQWLRLIYKDNCIRSFEKAVGLYKSNDLLGNEKYWGVGCRCICLISIGLPYAVLAARGVDAQ